MNVFGVNEVWVGLVCFIREREFLSFFFKEILDLSFFGGVYILVSGFSIIGGDLGYVFFSF